MYPFSFCDFIAHERYRVKDFLFLTWPFNWAQPYYWAILYTLLSLDKVKMGFASNPEAHRPGRGIGNYWQLLWADFQSRQTYPFQHHLKEK